MSTYIITEIDLITHEHVRYFKFKSEYGNKGWYRQTGSLNSFFFGKKKRCWSPFKFLYHLQRLEEIEMLDKTHIKLYGKKSIFSISDNLKEKGTVDCIDLYDFYVKIGYDRKSWKYLINPREKIIS